MQLPKGTPLLLQLIGMMAEVQLEGDRLLAGCHKIRGDKHVGVLPQELWKECVLYMTLAREYIEADDVLQNVVNAVGVTELALENPRHYRDALKARFQIVETAFWLDVEEHFPEIIGKEPWVREGFEVVTHIDPDDEAIEALVQGPVGEPSEGCAREDCASCPGLQTCTMVGATTTRLALLDQPQPVPAPTLPPPPAEISIPTAKPEGEPVGDIPSPS